VSELKPPPALPRPVLHAISRTKAWFLALSRPARVLLTSTVALALLFGLAVTYEKASEPWAPLFSQLDREDASTIVAKLKEMKIPYRVEADGTTVEVPESKARELRLELAGAGLPRGGGVGFESFDKMRLGATEFEQRVLYRRALEGELARTIGTLAAVESVRVHLVLPERSVFVSRSEPASASIVLRLRQGRVLGPSEVAGVVHLVASAVPGLEADRVALVTTEGTMLHRPRGAAGADSEAAGDEPDAHMAARTYETALEDRVRTMLERVVGPGHADVRVTADLDPSRVERLEEHFDPTRSSLRSEEQSIERASGEADDTVAGVPGAESNLPGGAARGSSAAASASASSSGAPESPPPAVRESHTRNYEIDHVTEKRTTVSGALRRLTIAVMLDGTKSDQGVVERPRAELDRLAQLVRSAAGASEVRGDMVTVESMPFARPETPDLVEPPVAPRSPTKLDLAKRWGPYAAAALFALVLLVVVMRRRTPAVAPALADSQLAAGETAASHLPGVPAAPQLEPAPVAALDMGDLRARAHSRAGEDPATAALVLRSWLGTTVPEASAAPRS
jgi:flagellar M-ring protein FliF